MIIHIEVFHLYRTYTCIQMIHIYYCMTGRKWVAPTIQTWIFLKWPIKCTNESWHTPFTLATFPKGIVHQPFVSFKELIYGFQN